MSQKPKKKGHSQAHQNKEKWRHNPNSVLTKKILALDHYCLCYRCEAQIEWRKTYRKYKPLKAMRKCNGCLGHEINRAYHTFCDKCATERGICAKCGIKYDITAKVKPVSDLEMLDTLKHADLKERYKRTILRNWERGLFLNADVLSIINLLLNGEHVVWEDWVVEDDCCDDDGHDHGAKLSKGAQQLLARQKLDLSDLVEDEKADATTTAATTTTTTTTTANTTGGDTTKSTTTPANTNTTTTSQEESIATSTAPTTTKIPTTTDTATTSPETTNKDTNTEPVVKKKITVLPKQTTSRVGAMAAAMPTKK